MCINVLKRFLVIFFIILSFTCCEKDDNDTIFVTANFESGSIGEVNIIDENSIQIHLANDNNNADLPDNWRSWWYVKIEHLSKRKITEIVIKNEGWPFYYLPVYSYDNKTWFRFTEDEVRQNGADETLGEIGELIIRKKFDNEEVWIARFYPYTFSKLKEYLDEIVNNPYVSITTPGFSQNGNSIYLIKISDVNVPLLRKKRILLHARTHPAETPSSFLIEGMIDFLLSGSEVAVQILKNYELYIFPMQNVDGVIAGNYRSTPKSENLEMMWYYDQNKTLDLTFEAPPEVNVIHQLAKSLMLDSIAPVSMALNLHASNSEPDIRPFFFPHFGNSAQGYTLSQASLWEQQLSFINSFANVVGPDMIEPVPDEGGSSFASKTYPESWWWVNFQDRVLAMTFEMTYGRAGYAPRWINTEDIRSFGESLMVSIHEYYSNPIVPLQLVVKGCNQSILKYPELYPPNAPDELKE